VADSDDGEGGVQQGRKSNVNISRSFPGFLHEIWTTAPVWHELQEGCRRPPFSRKWERIESFLNDVVRKNMIILPYDEQAGMQWNVDTVK